MDRLEWLKWRKGGIGSSDAPIIMDVSPWKTLLQLWEEKVSPDVKEDDSNSYIKRKGNEIEPKIRALYELIESTSFDPKLFTMESFPYMRASIDGYSKARNEIIEIKLVGKEDWELCKSGSVPQKYYPQVQHQLMVSNATQCFVLACYDPEMKGAVNSDNLAIVQVAHDLRYQEELLLNCVKFWSLVTSKKPPQPSDRDYKPLRGMQKSVQKWKRLKLKLEETERELDEVRSELIAAAEADGHPRLVCSGVRIQQISKIGNINYKSIPELKNVDLEKYRGKGSLYWKLGE